MVQRTLDNVYMYNGTLLNAEGLLDTMLVSSFSGPQTGTLDVSDTDGDINWDSTENATWNDANATFIGSGEASVSVTLLGIELSLSSSVPFNAWEVDGQTYVEYPEGDPAGLLDGLLSQALDFPLLSLLGVPQLVSLIEQNAILDFDLTNQNEIDLPVCFAKGTRIKTLGGWEMIENIKAGDLVMTQDHGAQPVRWIGHATARAHGAFAPVEIDQGVLGNDRPLTVSQQHRVLHGSVAAELLLGVNEVLLAAKHLVNGTTIRLRETGYVTYYHMLFDQHELVFSEGIATESFHPGAMAHNALRSAECEELFGLFPELQSDFNNYGLAARQVVKSYEADLLVVDAV